MTKKPSRPPRTCIFCGNTGLTREHVWANWLRNYIPKNRPRHSILSGIIERCGSLTHEIRHREGDPLSRQLRVVCGATKRRAEGCNNGWMGKLQETAKDIVIPLIKGDTYCLTKEHQRTLASWCAMTVMVAECLAKDQGAVTYSERNSLKTSGEPPSNWKIWIARYARHDWPSDWVHRSIRVSDTNVPNPADCTLPLPNTQFTTIIVGQLLIHAASCEDQSIIDGFNFEPWTNNLLVPIWPNQHTAVFWPPYAISDNQAIQIAEYGMRLYDGIGRMFGH